MHWIQWHSSPRRILDNRLFGVLGSGWSPLKQPRQRILFNTKKRQKILDRCCLQNLLIFSMPLVPSILMIAHESSPMQSTGLTCPSVCDNQDEALNSPQAFFFLFPVWVWITRMNNRRFIVLEAVALVRRPSEALSKRFIFEMLCDPLSASAFTKCVH